MMLKRIATGALALLMMAGAGFVAAGAGYVGAASAQEAAVEIKDFSIGNPDAPVKFIEYASFTCPHCARFHDEVFTRLKAEYIDTGKVHFEYREVYFDRYGLWAAMVARCGGDLRYFGIADILFSTQKEWAASDDPATVVANLKKIGRTAGMTDANLDVCMKDAPMAEAMVAHYEKNAKADGVEGTPTLIINGEKHPNSSYEDIKAILEAELAK